MPRSRTNRPRTRLALLVALLVAAVHVAVAHAVTFGADLTAPADNTGTCSILGQPSCTFFSGAPGPGFYAPLSGTVTAVRVKSGNFAQGPMQVVVMRSLYQNNVADPGHPFFACCFVERYGPIFTPAPNAVTTVPTALPMVEDPIPPPEDGVTNARGDFLALSVLDPNVPVPATFDNASVYSGFAPAPEPQTTPAPSPNPIFPLVNGFGYHIAMNADLAVGGGGDTVPVAIATGGQLVGSTAAIPLTCVLTTACEGRLRLANVPVAQATAVTRAKVYGKARFAIASGATAVVSVRLNRAGRRKTQALSTVTLLATAKVGKRVATSTVDLVRP
jgi:hypothetical protein